MPSTRNFKVGDHVEVDLNSDTGLPPLWVPAIVDRATDLTYGWTAATTHFKSKHPGISRTPGWTPNEIRPSAKEQG